MQDPSASLDQATQPGVWQFGKAVLDEQVAALRMAGTQVELDRSAYDVLLALLRHAGEIVTKDELLDAGWPGRVVSENSLAKAVSRLRQALGEDGDAIRVVHGYGYRLAVAVSFQAVPVDKVTAHPHAAERLHEGDRLPHRPGWRLGRRLGEGSAGVIFLTQSESGETRAVKLATSEAGLRSLKREIALARYIRSVKPDLPCVAPVIDWNLSQPPFFLELPFFAEGHLSDWAAAAGGLQVLDLATRLSLCVRLCEAVAALHEIGIIHKDLKPENVYPLADDNGDWHVVLSDLGAGEAAQSPRWAELGITMSIAATGDLSSPRAGSLLYMAPEVIAGELPTQRSDVFALGMLVYQLVVGDLRRSIAPGWEADVGDELLCQDIALAAAANPERRLIDARGLAERLRSLEQRRATLEHERESHRLDQLRVQQIARDRTRWKLGLAVGVALGLGLAGTTVLYATAEKARREAEKQAQQTQAVLDFVNRDILGQDDAYGSAARTPDLTLQAAVDRAAARVDDRLRGDPASAAAVHAMVGHVFFARDQHAAAIREFDKARAGYRRLGRAHGASLTRVETGLCDVHRIASDFPRAEEACMAAWQRARADKIELPLATLKLGQLRTEQGHYVQAEALLQPLLQSNALQADAKALGELRWSLGLCARNRGHFEQARRHFEALLALYQRAGGDSTWTGWAYNSLGSVLVETGDYTRAEQVLLTARQAFIRTQGAGQVEAQMPNIWRAEIRLRQGRWGEAAAMQRALLDAWSPTLKPEHPLRLKAEANLAWAEAAAGHTASAQARLDAALRKRHAVFDRADARIAGRTLRWTRTALVLGDSARSRELLRVLDTSLAREFPEPHPLRAEAQCLHAQWSLAQEDRRAARRQAAACATMLAQFVGPEHPLLLESQALLATLPPPASAAGSN